MKTETLFIKVSQKDTQESFSVADNCEVKGAELKDGLLRVSLERIIRKHKNLE
jgi:molecular chaperone IbpA